MRPRACARASSPFRAAMHPFVFGVGVFCLRRAANAAVRLTTSSTVSSSSASSTVAGPDALGAGAGGRSLRQRESATRMAVPFAELSTCTRPGGLSRIVASTCRQSQSLPAPRRVERLANSRCLPPARRPAVCALLHPHSAPGALRLAQCRFLAGPPNRHHSAAPPRPRPSADKALSTRSVQRLRHLRRVGHATGGIPTRLCVARDAGGQAPHLDAAAPARAHPPGSSAAAPETRAGQRSQLPQ